MNDIDRLISDIDGYLSDLQNISSSIPMLRQTVAEYQGMLEMRRAQITMQRGGWAKLGKNDTERKMQLVILANADDQYTAIQNDLKVSQRALDEAIEEKDVTLRQISSRNHVLDFRASENFFLSSRIRTATNDVNGNGNRAVDINQPEPVDVPF